MIFDQQDLKESQTIEALVPMVDLFAVLAIVRNPFAQTDQTVLDLPSDQESESDTASTWTHEARKYGSLSGDRYR